jgi:peptidoglycan hydrolase-like protein with peptidoglycan-binding domain
MRWIVGGISALAVAATAAGVQVANGQTMERPPAASTGTAKVVRTDLTETTEVDGSLGYGETHDLPNRRQGVVTAILAKGATATRGRALYRVNGEPVILLYGNLPAYRSLAPGTEGADVEQFERNLAALGYSGFTVDDEYTAKTAAAVRKWQKDLGVEQTGTVEPAAISYAEGPVRIAGHKAPVGSDAGGPVVSVTGTTRIVTVKLPVDDQRLARKGAAVTVTIPGGGTATGTITTVGNVAEKSGDDQQDGGESTIPVTITLKDVQAAGNLDEAPVDVQLVSESRKGVLAVPVAALLALREGGYGVAIVDGGSRRVVKVETGMFADGLVEVTGDGLAEGTNVEVPAS